MTEANFHRLSLLTLAVTDEGFRVSPLIILNLSVEFSILNCIIY